MIQKKEFQKPIWNLLTDGLPKRSIIPVYAWDRELGLTTINRKAKGEKRASKSLVAILYQNFRDFCSNTSLHGFKYITAPDTFPLERGVWFICCMAAIASSFYFIYPIVKRYSSTPIITTIESTSIPIWNVPFPGVTICNVNKVSKERIDRITESDPVWRRYGNGSMTDLVDLMAHIGQVTRIDKDKEDVEELKQIVNQQGSRVDDLMRDVSQSVQRMALSCWWLSTRTNCSQILEQRRTDEGYCWSFNAKPMKALMNGESLQEDEEDTTASYDDDDAPQMKGMMESLKLVRHQASEKLLSPQAQQPESSRKSKRVNGAGPNMGLSVLLNPDNHDYYTTTNEFNGFKVLIHDPTDFPSVSTKAFVVSAGREVFAAVTVTSTRSTESIKATPKKKRDCLFEDERKLNFYSSYSYANCLLECRVRSMKRTCQCVPYIYAHLISRLGRPHDTGSLHRMILCPLVPQDHLRNNTKICNYTGMLCISKNARRFASILPKEHVDGLENIKSMRDCNCPSGCDETSYFTEVTAADFPRDINDMNLTQYPPEVDPKNLVLLRVFFKDMFFVRYKRDLLYTWNNLIADFGGVVSLFIGFTFISFIELIYFLTIRVFLRWHISPADPESR